MFNEQIIEICNFINNYQKEFDIDFKCIPIDEHEYITLNIKNVIIKFIFSNKLLQMNCISQIPQELLSNVKMVSQQEDTGYTIYF